MDDVDDGIEKEGNKGVMRRCRAFMLPSSCNISFKAKQVNN